LASARQIAARILEEERQRGASRQAAIDAVLAKPPPPRVTKENWDDWHRRGWIVCPAKRQRTCSDTACGVGANCKRMAAGDGTPLRRKDRPRCGARTQKGTPRLVRVEDAADSMAGSQPPQDRRGDLITDPIVQLGGCLAECPGRPPH
jgi:hypothetical protein